MFTDHPPSRPVANTNQTSLDKTGSDAMNAAGDYSAAYCILNTDSEFSGHGMVSHTIPSPASPHLNVDSY